MSGPPLPSLPVGLEDDPAGADFAGPPRRDLLAGLNPAQREAVLHDTGPLLILAGAGSGKTRVLTHRIAHLIAERGASPFSILAITFTNKAADEMRRRVAGLVGPVAERMWVSTFHSACVRILRREASRLGYKSSFTIYDQADAVRLTGYVIRDLNIDSKRFPPRSVHGVISQAKNELVDFEHYREQARTIFDRKVADVYAEYQKRLLAASAMDFDDLLMVTVNLMQAFPDVLERYRHRFEHLLVDEYQDTNRAQNELVITLAEAHRNLCVVGDSDQCLPPGTLVSTPAGPKPIEELTEGDRVTGTGGRGVAVAGEITHVKRGHWQGRMYTVRAGGRTLRGTPHHILLAKPDLPPGGHLVYLMYRADRGYRVGQAKSVRQDGQGRPDSGLRVRANQEHADKMWILRSCADRAEASYWEAWFSATYGLPTACFHGQGRDLAMDERWLARLFDELDTRTAAKALMLDLDLHPAFPHLRPQNGRRRQSINLTMFGHLRYGDVGDHRVQSSRFETARESYPEAVELARAVADAGGMEIHRRAAIGGQIYDFMPLAHLHPGMTVLVEEGGHFVEATVDSAESDFYDGPVYDLEVTPTHTYGAGGILVHNSIYRFRSADIRNILEFERAFPDATVIVLEQNYRSTQTILDAANAVIANNMQRKPKALWTDQVGGEPIVRYEASDEHDEAAWVAQEIGSLHDGADFRYGDMAVFYRTNAQSRVLEEELVRRNIPYRVVGGTRFYDRREIKDLLAYLRAVSNPADEVSLKRIVNVPRRGVGDTSVGRIDVFARQHGLGFGDALARAEDAGVSGRALTGARALAVLLESLRRVAPDGPGPVLRRVLEETGYAAELEAEHTVEAAGRLENIAELVAVADEHDDLDGFLEAVSLVADTDELSDDETSVSLMTLHTAKGLEFPVVFLVGMEEGVFPHMRSIGEPDEMEEERRLCYVGITRARQRLYLSHAFCRTLWGGASYNPPSRFIAEIPEALTRAISGGGPPGSLRGGGVRAGRDRIVESAMKATPARTSGAEALGLRAGDDVVHAKWGEGVVTEVVGSGDKAEAVVVFPGLGEKRLLLAWAPLKKAR
ncbi:MAG TPA: UvrD-helicase domain-containing protein [Acidimicrobiales bacterium]|nr:UvrD-helicase domain-containing protein [Acidimicrobiales bacterium]